MSTSEKRSVFVQFADRVRSLLGGSQLEGLGDSQSDRRVWIRYPCEIQTTLEPAYQPDSVKLPAQVKNISRGGIKLQVAQPFENGSLLSIDLSDQQDDESASSVLAYVVHAAPVSAGEYSLGCVFAVELEEDDLSGLGASRRLAAPSDQRTWVRFNCNGEVSYQLARAGNSPPHDAQVFDISPTGIGLRVKEPQNVGVVLHILAPIDSSSEPFRILATVVRTCKLGDQWALGCTFIRELDNAEVESVLRKSQPTPEA